jgi:hypothetical protein
MTLVVPYSDKKVKKKTGRKSGSCTSLQRDINEIREEAVLQLLLV